MSQQHGLGRGLASLIPPKISSDGAGNAVPIRPRAEQSVTPVGAGVSQDTEMRQVLEVPVGHIIPNPHQPREDFSEEHLAELASSIREHGILQPLIVTRRGESFELIAGERRLQAAKRVGLTTVPIIVHEAQDLEKFELAIIENIQRQDLNALEEARAYRRLIDEFHLTQEEVAQKMGKSRSLVANTLRLLQLPAEIQRGLLEGKVNEGHAKAILSVEGTEKQMALYETIIKEQLTVREAERRSQMVTPKTYKRVSIPDPKAKEVEERLSEVLGTKVHVTHVGKGGRVSIEYYGPEDLDHLLTKLGA